METNCIKIQFIDLITSSKEQHLTNSCSILWEKRYIRHQTNLLNKRQIIEFVKNHSVSYCTLLIVASLATISFKVKFHFKINIFFTKLNFQVISQKY
jgi:hypothetical protein